MDIDDAIRLDMPVEHELDVPAEIWDHWERWERSNRLCYNFIKSKLSAGIRGSVGQHQNVKDLLKALDEQFTSSEKAHAMTLIMKLTSKKSLMVKEKVRLCKKKKKRLYEKLQTMQMLRRN